MVPEPHYVRSVDELRDVVAHARPDEILLIAVHPKTSFDDAKQLWEAVTLAENHFKLVNVEALSFKHEGSVFVEERIQELQVWRDHISGKIGTMQGWINLMKAELDAGGPEVPSHYTPVLLHGPMLFLDVDQVGTINGEQNRKTIMNNFGYAGPTALRAESTYWKRVAYVEREMNERCCFLKLNLQVLKIEGLTTLRDRITEGIRELRHMSSVSTHIGSGNIAFSGFRDVEMMDVKRARDGPAEKGHKRARVGGDGGADGMVKDPYGDEIGE